MKEEELKAERKRVAKLSASDFKREIRDFTHRADRERVAAQERAALQSLHDETQQRLATGRASAPEIEREVAVRMEKLMAGGLNEQDAEEVARHTVAQGTKR